MKRRRKRDRLCTLYNYIVLLISMERQLFKNALSAKFVIGGFLFGSLWVQKTVYKAQLL